MASSSLAGVSIKMAADLEWASLRVAELQITDHEFDQYVGGMQRHRPAAPLEEVPLRPQAVALLALRWHDGDLAVVSLQMFRNLEQKIDATAHVEELAFGLLGAALR